MLLVASDWPASGLRSDASFSCKGSILGGLLSGETSAILVAPVKSLCDKMLEIITITSTRAPQYWKLSKLTMKILSWSMGKVQNHNQDAITDQ